MKYLPDVFERNRAWAEARIAEDPGFFSRLAHIQRPDLLWIGCSDSLVPANEIVGLAPGESFVHRNVANIVPVTDLNALAVVEYAVKLTRCAAHRRVRPLPLRRGQGGARGSPGRRRGAVAAAAAQPRRRAPRGTGRPGVSEDARWDRLCELNVAAQVRAVAQTEIVEAAWERGADLAVHGWIYDLEDGCSATSRSPSAAAEQLAGEARAVLAAERAYRVPSRLRGRRDASPALDPLAGHPEPGQPRDGRTVARAGGARR